MKNDKGILSQRILHYLEKHPGAGDTLEGIVTWWLDQEIIDHVVDNVSDVLLTLEQKGSIQSHTYRSGTTIYKIRQ